MHFGYYIGIAKQTELLMLSFLGIICTIFDASLLDFNTNLYKIWDIKLDPNKFSERMDLYMKYLLSGVVLVRTFTVHIYLGCYIIMLYPALFEDRPGLILPWMFVSAVKCLLTGFLSLSAGVYTCMLYRFMQPTCWEFLLTQFLDHAPSVYMFLLVLSYYRGLKKLQRFSYFIDPMERQALRRKTRLLTEGSFEINFDNRNWISTSTIDNALMHFSNNRSRGNSRSLDNLLEQMKEDEERSEIFNDDDNDAEDKSLSVQERTTRLLHLTNQDIESAKQGRSQRIIGGKEVYRSMTSLGSSSRIHKNSSKFKKPASRPSDVVLIPSETEVRTIMPDSVLPERSNISNAIELDSLAHYRSIRRSKSPISKQSIISKPSPTPSTSPIQFTLPTPFPVEHKSSYKFVYKGEDTDIVINRKPTSIKEKEIKQVDKVKNLKPTTDLPPKEEKNAKGVDKIKDLKPTLDLPKEEKFAKAVDKIKNLKPSSDLPKEDKYAKGVKNASVETQKKEEITPIPEAPMQNVLTNEITKPNQDILPIPDPTIGMHKDPNHAESKRKSSPRTTLTKPTKFKDPHSITSTSQMEGNATPLKEYYKNRSVYPNSYKDDGYTQAFYDSILNKGHKENVDK